MDTQEITAHSPIWTNAEHTKIDLQVKFPFLPTEVLFTADPNDVMEYGRQIFELANTGSFGTVAEYQPLSP